MAPLAPAETPPKSSRSGGAARPRPPRPRLLTRSASTERTTTAPRNCIPYALAFPMCASDVQYGTYTLWALASLGSVEARMPPGLYRSGQSSELHLEASVAQRAWQLISSQHQPPLSSVTTQSRELLLGAGRK